MKHFASWALILLGLWAVLSGYWHPLLIALGALSCGFVLWIAWRMDVVDRESHPIHLLIGRFLPYLVWLVREIIKANIDVTRRILDPALPISPTITRLRASQITAIGRVTYANSITLTPGTVTIDLDGDQLVVHALTASAARALDDGEMDRRVRVLEGMS